MLSARFQATKSGENTSNPTAQRPVVDSAIPFNAKRSSASSTARGGVGEPIAYFGSGAASWRAREGHSGGQDGRLWYQPYVISGSLAVFLIYFCILREENDIDTKLEGSLFDHVAGLEETQLRIAYNYNKEHGLATVELEKRLAEVQNEKE